MKQHTLTADKTYSIDYIDASGACAFARCDAKHFFSRVLHLRARDAMTIPMDFGTAIHAAMPHTYNGGSVDNALRAFSLVWERFEHGEGDKKRNVMRAGFMLEDAIKFHKSAPYKPLDPPVEVENLKKTIEFDEISDKEIPVLFDYGTPLLSAGRIDRVVEWKDTGDLWVLDYKTSGEVSARIFSNFEFSVAALNYTLGYSLLTNKMVRGLVIELLRVSPTNAETLLHQVFVQEHQLHKYIAWLQRTTERLLEANTTQKWMQCPSGCAPYSMFGTPGYQCPYNILCSIPDWREGVKFFDVKEWHPFRLSK